MTYSNAINLTSSLLPGLDKPDKLSINKLTVERAVTKESVSRAAESGPSALASDSTSLSAALSSALSSDDVRSVKVEALRAAINDGSYSVPSSNLADSLIDKMSRG